MQVRSLGQEDPLEEGMATHSSVPAWRIPRTEGPGGLQSMGSCESDANEHTGNREEGSGDQQGVQRARQCGSSGFSLSDRQDLNFRRRACSKPSFVAHPVKSPPAVRETWVPSLAWEGPLEKGQATHCSILGLPQWLSW